MTKSRTAVRLVENALDRIGAGIKAELLQFPGDPLVAPEDIFRSDANDDVAQASRQARSTHGFEGASAARLGEPALVGRGPGYLHEPIDIVPAFRPDAQQFGFLGGRQDYPLRRNAGPQNMDLGLEQPHLCVVPGSEKLGQGDQKERERRIHLAKLHHDRHEKLPP
ncbi:MAG: hypothetical protein K8F90_14150 [Hyphomicrobiales bacterium]|nr:hypothetical protein [Hyphomicrobiales bacterium]